MNTDTTNQHDQGQTWGILGTTLWGILIIAAFFIAQFVATAALYPDLFSEQLSAAERELLVKEASANGNLMAWATLAAFGACTVIIILAVAVKSGSRMKDYLALRGFDLKSGVIWFGAILVLGVLIDGTNYLLGRPMVPDFMRNIFETAQPLWLLGIAVVIAAPVFEELFFRGFLLTGLKETVVGSGGAIVITSFVWAIGHVQYDMFFVVAIFLIGILLGVARLATGSLYLVIGLHALMNFISLVQTGYLLSRGVT